MTKDKEKSLAKYVLGLENRLQSVLRGSLSEKHAKRNSGKSLKEFLTKEISMAKQSLERAKGI